VKLVHFHRVVIEKEILEVRFHEGFVRQTLLNLP